MNRKFIEKEMELAVKLMKICLISLGEMKI